MMDIQDYMVRLDTWTGAEVGTKEDGVVVEAEVFLLRNTAYPEHIRFCKLVRHREQNQRTAHCRNYSHSILKHHLCDYTWH